MKHGRYLNDQGIKGPPYKLVVGNTTEDFQLRNEAQLKPMDLSHAIVPRVLPFHYRTFKTYGIFFPFCMIQYQFFLVLEVLVTGVPTLVTCL